MELTRETMMKDLNMELLIKKKNLKPGWSLLSSRRRWRKKPELLGLKPLLRRKRSKCPSKSQLLKLKKTMMAKASSLVNFKMLMPVAKVKL
jgi:hypothetical protein